MGNFNKLITIMNVDSSKKLFLIVGGISLVAMIIVLFLKRKNK